MSLTPNPFCDPADALLGSGPSNYATRHCPLIHGKISRVQIPPRTHQAAVPSSTRNGPDCCHSRVPTDMSRRVDDLEQASKPCYHGPLISQTALWSVGLVGQISLLSSAAAFAILMGNLGSKDASAGTGTWLALSLLVFIISVAAGALIYKARQNRKLARFRREVQREASFDPQWQIPLQSLNSSRRHQCRNDTNSASLFRPPQSFEQPNSSRVPYPVVTAGIATVNQNVPIYGMPRGGLHVASSQMETGEDIGQQFRQQSGTPAGSVGRIYADNNDTQNQNLTTDSHGLPNVLFRKPLVPLPRRGRPLAGESSGTYNATSQQVNRSPPQSTIDLDRVFNSDATHEYERDVGNRDSEGENSFPYHVFGSKIPRPSTRRVRGKPTNPFDTPEGATSGSPRFVIGSDELSSPEESESPFTPDNRLHQYCASPSYSHGPADSANVDRDESPHDKHAARLSGEKLQTLTGEERRMYFEQRRRCFSTQENLVGDEEDSTELEDILNHDPSMRQSIKGKENEKARRSKRATAGDLEFDMEANAFSPVVHSGPMSAMQFAQHSAHKSPTAPNSCQEPDHYEGQDTYEEYVEYQESGQYEGPDTYVEHVEYQEPYHYQQPEDESQPAKISEEKVRESTQNTPKKLQLKFSPQRQIYSFPSQDSPQTTDT